MTEEEILSKIDDWNSSTSNQELHEYLGLTWNQYAIWLYCLVIIESEIATKLVQNFSPSEILKIKQAFLAI